MKVYGALTQIQAIIDDLLEDYDDTSLIKQLDNLHIETRPISPEQETKFLYYNMAVDDCIKVVQRFLKAWQNE